MGVMYVDVHTGTIASKFADLKFYLNHLLNP